MSRTHSLIVCVLIASLATVAESQASAPAIHLDETLFISAKAEVGRDHDGDWLKDDLEFKIADVFRPQLIFDSDEKARRPNEPVALFQVRPIACVGFGCNTPYQVLIRYVYLWQKDGGYGASASIFCDDAHNGDNVAISLFVESDNGKDWTLVEIANFHFIWPASKKYGDKIGLNNVQWHQESHVVLYMSAHKHHLYFDTSYDGDDSVESEHGCNDDVNGKGAKVLPSLTSPYPDHRPSNVGEPELHPDQHCLEYKKDVSVMNITFIEHCVKWSTSPPSETFVNELGSYGFPAEAAWSRARFCGGLGCDSDETISVAEMWQRDPFTISQMWDTHEMTGGMRGRLADTNGKPIRNVVLYYRAVLVGLLKGGAEGPWSKLPVDKDGNYDAKLTFGIYELRPVASDYRFADVPKPVELKRGEYTTTNFTATAESPIAATASVGGFGVGLRPVNPKMEVVKTYVLTDSGLMQMVVDDPQASDQGKGASDPFVKLPRHSILSFHVESILDQSGHPAKSLADAICSSSYVKLPDGTTTLPCHLGGPVEGATIEVRLASGPDAIEPESSAVVRLTTNSDGNAFLKLQSGVRPGTAALLIDLTSNPVNPWAVFRYGRQPVEIQPALHGDDSRTQPRVALVQVGSREQAALGSHYFSATENGSGGFMLRPRALTGDVNSDFVVDQKDIEVIRRSSGQRAGQAGFKRKLDLNGDHVIDEKDELVVKANLGRRMKPPSEDRRQP